MNFPFFIARRFFRSIGKDKKSASNPTITIATTGVAVGLAVMIITVSVIAGFKREVTSKVNGFASDIEVLDYRSISSPEGYPITADSAFIAAAKKWPGVKRVDKIAQKMGILKTEEEFQGVTLKGIDAGYDTTFVAAAITKGRLPRLDVKPDPDAGIVGSNEIAISSKIASDLGLEVGDRVFAYFFEENIRMRRFKVSGIYCTNMSIFDKNFIITDYATVADLNQWNLDKCSSLEVRLDGTTEEATKFFAKNEALDKAMLAATEYCAKNPDDSATRRPLSVREHYKQIFDWLNLLDFNMIVILVLMICVAGFTMISGLLILILERTQTIGVLKALGATNAKIRSIFLNFSALITIRGLLIGDALALALLFAQQKWGFVHLDPTSYYVETVPVELSLLAIVLLNLITLVLTTIALVAPSFMISHIQPAKAIRYE